MIVLDTSVLIDSLTGPKQSGSRLIELFQEGERFVLSTLVLYEWLRGPRTREDLTVQEELFPSASATPFGPAEADLSAKIYRSIGRPRSRELDIGIAACAMHHNAELWTRNAADFSDIPGLRLFRG